MPRQLGSAAEACSGAALPDLPRLTQLNTTRGTNGLPSAYPGPLLAWKCKPHRMKIPQFEASSEQRL